VGMVKEKGGLAKWLIKLKRYLGVGWNLDILFSD